MEIKKAEIKYAIPCGVCEEPIELNEWEVRHTTFRLCSECIKAIKFVRRLMIANPKMDTMLPCLEDNKE